MWEQAHKVPQTVSFVTRGTKKTSSLMGWGFLFACFNLPQKQEDVKLR